MKPLLTLLFAALSMSAATIKVTFNHDRGTQAICSATVTTNCQDHYEAGLTEGSTFTSAVNIPIPAGTGPATGITGQFVTNKYGALTVTVVAVGKGTTGNRTVSAPLSVNLNVDYVPNPVTGLQGDVTISLTFKLDGTVTARVEKAKP